MTYVRVNVDVDLSDIDTGDLITELEARDDWDLVCEAAPTPSLEHSLSERDDSEMRDYRDEWEAIYELLHQGKESAAIERVAELACEATGRIL